MSSVTRRSGKSVSNNISFTRLVFYLYVVIGEPNELDVQLEFLFSSTILRADGQSQVLKELLQCSHDIYGQPKRLQERHAQLLNNYVLRPIIIC